MGGGKFQLISKVNCVKNVSSKETVVDVCDMVKEKRGREERIKEKEEKNKTVLAMT